MRTATIERPSPLGMSSNFSIVFLIRPNLLLRAGF
jgi:hypothetical protein